MTETEKEAKHEGEDSEGRREKACCQGSGEEGGCEEEEIALQFQPAATEPVMSRLAALVVSVAAAAYCAEAAAAVSLTNRDDREHRVTVVEGERRQDHTLAPLAILEGFCPNGCVIRLNDSEDDEYKLEGNETISIEEGFVYYDDPEIPEQPAPGDESEGAGKQ